MPPVSEIVCGEDALEYDGPSEDTILYDVIVFPPLDSPDHETMSSFAVDEDALAVVGADGTVVINTELEVVAAEVPAALLPVTENVYDVFEDKPVNSKDVLDVVWVVDDGVVVIE